jgi:hypothetical protein
VERTFQFYVSCRLGFLLISQRVFIVEANVWTYFEGDFIKKKFKLEKLTNYRGLINALFLKMTFKLSPSLLLQQKIAEMINTKDKLQKTKLSLLG